MDEHAEILGKGYDAHLLRRLWPYVRRHRRLAVGSLLLLPLVMTFNLLQPKILQLAIDRAIARGQMGDLPLYVLAFLGALLAEQAASYFQIYFLQLLGERSTCDLRVTAYRHVLSLRLAFFERTPVGKLLVRVSSDVEAISEAFQAGVVTLIADGVRIIVILGILLHMDAQLTLIALGTAPVLFAIAQIARRAVRNAFRRLRRCLAELNAFLQEHLAGMSIVQLFGREARVRAEFSQRNQAYRSANLSAIRADASLYAIVEMVGSCALAALLFGGASRLAHGTLTVGVLIAFTQYMERLFAPIRDLSSKYTVLQSAMAGAERIFALLDNRELDAPELPDHPRLSSPPPVHSGPLVQVDRVRFAYQAGHPVLEDVSLSLAPGETVALVGTSGSGKSTLVKLLVRLYDVSEGTIRYGGLDVRSWDARLLRRRIVLVPQDPILFSGTLRETLSLGDSSLSDDQLGHALARIGGSRVLASRSEGLGAIVRERGCNFSGGERQLLAFARALLRDPELLILDEATAHVDPETEHLIEQGTAELMRGRTSIVIAHRLATLHRADRIVVLHHGRIAEQGRHADLLKSGGLYATLYRLQMTGEA